MDSSLLAMLPAELRDTIYKFVLTQSWPIRITAAGNKGLRKESGTVNKTHCTLVALTKTCKQLRAEAGPLFFSQNTFTVLAVSSATLRMFCEAIGSRNTSALRTVIVDVEYPYRTSASASIVSTIEEAAVLPKRCSVTVGFSLFALGQVCLDIGSVADSLDTVERRLRAKAKEWDGEDRESADYRRMIVRCTVEDVRRLRAELGIER